MSRLHRFMACVACLLACSLPALPGEDGGSAGGTRGGGRRGQLTDEQIQQLRERFEQRQKEKGGNQPGAAGLDPKKASTAMVAEAFKSGETAYKAENYPGAFEFLVDVAACAHIQGAAAFADKSRAMILEMEKMAADKLEEARLKKLQGDGPGALEILKVLREKFYFTRVADEANNLLVALATDPRVAAAVDMIKAEEADTAGRYAEAAEKYESIMKKFPESVQALKAKLRLEAMKKDEAIAAAIKEGAGKAADTACPKWLATARNYLANGRTDQARPYFQKVIENYPDSAYAKEAQQALDELNAPKKDEAGGGAK
ncbi:MAG TPA: tetratricopeptide repeat protein [Planctomycetota bacterium]|nr:tetratricopeptide repeat protein [Planctomycetota bacterium]